MHFAQIYTPGIAQCSYVIGTGKECVVVDPTRNIRPYLAKAKEFGMQITAILETHLHADFISGHMDLADVTGATIYAPEIASCSFPHKALKNEEEFTIGQIRFKLLETPGHTPDSTVYVVTDLERGKEPVLVFTGDTLMVGDVGRPDLFPNRDKELAEKLFYSLKRLQELPDHLEVYPAHGMGSLCGRALSAKLWSTIGIEKRFNYALQHKEPESFKQDLLADMPSAPDHFARCSEINRVGPALVSGLEETLPLSPSETAQAAEEGSIILDVRPFQAFASAHLPASYSISRHGNLATFAGWVIEPENKIILVLDDGAELGEIKEALYNVGLDNITGYLDGSIESWIKNGMEVTVIETISVHGLRDLIDKERPRILDTRAENEWKTAHIKGVELAPAPDVRHLYNQWDRGEPLIVLCNTSNRSMTTASLLKQRGFKRVINVLGGTTAWEAAGYPMQTEGEDK